MATTFRSHWAPTISDPSPKSFVPVSTWEKDDVKVMRKLKVKEVTEYLKIWDDTNTAAEPHRLAIFQPVAPVGYEIVGHLVERSHHDTPTESALAVRVEHETATDTPLLQPPVDYFQVWESAGTKGSFGKCSLWRPIPPEDYVCLGYVANNSFAKPSLDAIKCVHFSAVKKAVVTYEEDGAFLWSDRHSNASFGDVSIWRTTPENKSIGVSMNTFIAVPHHNKPSEPAFCLLNPNYKPTAMASNSATRIAEQSQERELDQAASIHSDQANHQPITFMEFAINPSRVQGLFTTWKESLWFAPADFKTGTSKAEFKGIFVPYYLGSCAVSSRYSGEIGVPDTEAQTPTMDWTPVNGVHQQQYNNVLVCASDANSKTMSSSVETWDLNLLQTTTTYNPNLLENPLSWNTCESTFVEKINKAETKQCKEEMKSKLAGAIKTKDVKVNTQRSGTRNRLVFLPIYVASFEYQATTYHFIVNGQNGATKGQRPYGLGTLSKVLHNLGHVFSREATTPSLVSGEELNTAEATDVYSNSSCYLTLPRSRNYVVKSGCGFIKLNNKGNSEIELLSQEKGAHRRGFPFLLRAGVTQVFNFKGSWVIEIVSGNAVDLDIVEFETHGGSKKKKDNVLGMA